MGWVGWNLVPGNPPNSVSGGAVDSSLAVANHLDEIHLFALDNATKQVYWNKTSDAGDSWSGWQPVDPSPPVTSLSAVRWEGRVHLFGVSPSSNFQVFVNTFQGGQPSQWHPVPGTEYSAHVCAAAVSQVGTDHLYLFLGNPLDKSISWIRSGSASGSGLPLAWSNLKKLPSGGDGTDKQIAAGGPLGGENLTLVRRAASDSRIQIMPHFTLGDRKPNPNPTWHPADPPLLTTQTPAIAQPSNLNPMIYARSLTGDIYEKPKIGPDDWLMVPGAVKTSGLAAVRYFVAPADNGVLLFTRLADKKIYCNRRDYAV